jgi:hypothetical protein
MGWTPSSMPNATVAVRVRRRGERFIGKLQKVGFERTLGLVG